MLLVFFEAPLNRSMTPEVAANALLAFRPALLAVEALCVICHIFDLMMLLYTKVAIWPGVILFFYSSPEEPY
jgi:hypothetical protein